MASIKISELEEVTKLSTSDVLPIINENKTKKVSLEKLNEILGGGGESGSGSVKMLVIEFDNNLRTFDTDTNKAILTEYYNSIRNDEFVELFVAFNKFGGAESGDSPYWYRASVMELDDYYLKLHCPSYINTSQSQNIYGINYHEMRELDVTASVQISGENYSIVSITHYYNNSWALNVNNKILGINNVTAFTPTGDYNPATKKYVDDAIANIDIPEGDGGNGGLPQPMYFVTSNNITIGSDNTDSDICAKFSEILTNARAFWNANGMHQIVLIDNKDYTNVIFKSKPGSFGTYYGTCYYPKVFDTLEKTYELKLTYSSSNSIYTVTKFRINEITVKRTATDPTENNQVATKKYVDDGLSSKQDTLIAGDNITISNNVISASASGGGSTGESEQRYIRLTGGYNFFSGWLQSYPTFNSDDLAAISEYVTKYYKNDDLKSLLPLTIINNKKSTSSPLTEAQVITINNIYNEFGTIHMQGTVFKPNSDQRSGCFNNIYGVAIMLLSYTWEDGVFNCTRAGFRNEQINGYLSKTNTEVFTPTGDYNPATKKYVDDAVKNSITSVLEAEY